MCELVPFDSAELARRIEGNPYNLPGDLNFPPLPGFAYQAARFEREGRRAYPDGLQPYAPHTLAGTRWQAGYEQSRALHT